MRRPGSALPGANAVRRATWAGALVAFAATITFLTDAVAQRTRLPRESDDHGIVSRPDSSSGPVSREQYDARFGAFDGTVFVRISVTAPLDFRYRIAVKAEVQPYGAEFVDVGQFPRSPASFGSRDRSDWIRLPNSTNPGWNVNFTIQPAAGTLDWMTATVRFDLAVGPSDDQIFRRVEEAVSGDLVATLYMPTSATLDGLNGVMTDSEFAEHRLKLAVQATRDLEPPPRLKRLRIFTETSVEPQRWGGGLVRPERVETELTIMKLLGVNSVGLGIESFEGVADDDWIEIAPVCGIRGTTFRAWCGMVPFGPHYGTGDSFPDIVRKYTDADHAARAAKFKDVLSFRVADTFITGDEIVPPIDPGWLGVRAIRDYFERYLAAEGLDPQFFGAGGWAQVQPTIDRKVIGRSPQDARRFYWFRRFANHVAALLSRANTDAILAHYPHPRIVTSNFHAGPVDFGYLGNSNDMDANNLDIFEIGR